jgi:eukaryotic-like serine/threonine-protein kinase
MGVVFRARDTQLARTVAIKVLPTDRVADGERNRRFLQEARAASALNHPNIVTIHDVSSDQGTEFIVMEYVDGATLDRHIAAHGFPVRQALDFAVQIADGLAKAHEAGIIHRDLKPSNVIVGNDGGVKILDFGVAKLVEALEPTAPTMTAVATEEGMTVGTPSYMSPEQAEGRRVDSRSDIFSFGAVLYEMVTGRKAFSGESRLSVLAKILNDEPPPPSQLAPAVPPDLEKAILRCLRKDPARRFQTMADLKVALEDLADESTSTARVQPIVPPARSRLRWLVAAAIPVLLIALYFATRIIRTPEVDEPLQAVPITALSGQVRYPTLSPDGNHVAFAWTGAAGDNMDLYVQQIGAGSPLRLTTDPNIDTSPAWSARRPFYRVRTSSGEFFAPRAAAGGAARWVRTQGFRSHPEHTCIPRDHSRVVP